MEAVLREEETKIGSPSGSGRGSPAAVSSSSTDRKTAAEKRFEEVRRKRVRLNRMFHISCNSLICPLQLAEKVAKLADKSHKDRVNEFNNKLEALSEHHDIPKVRASIEIRLFILLNSCYSGWTWLTLRDAFFLPYLLLICTNTYCNFILYSNSSGRMSWFFAILEVSEASREGFKHRKRSYNK